MAELIRVKGKFALPTFLAGLLIPLAAGCIGALLSASAGEIYASLRLPSFAPPVWVFTPAGIVLLALAGLSFYRVLMAERTEEVKGAILYFAIQLVFGLLWNILFFGFHLHAAALIDNIILLFYVLIATVKFFKIDRTAGLMLLPYVVWAFFAAVVNLAVVLLNG